MPHRQKNPQDLLIHCIWDYFSFMVERNIFRIYDGSIEVTQHQAITSMTMHSVKRHLVRSFCSVKYILDLLIFLAFDLIMQMIFIQTM